MATPPTAPMYDSDSATPPKCSRVTYMALAFFLGVFGVHNFVAGHTKKGFIQLGLGAGGFVLSVFLIGIPMLLAAAVWAIVDMFTVTEDGMGVPFDSASYGSESDTVQPSSPLPSPAATTEAETAKAA
ncbi:MAG: hypothetical protein DHS20C14_20760 [Phycisphaeraceae bacterium]|nr:MAG: hypothetical protein DHS20C14_20760 [Phycisphaeraceae bacterium]